MIFKKSFQILEKKVFILFHFIFFNAVYVITAPYMLKGSLNFQGFALIRAVLCKFQKRSITSFKIFR